MGNTEYIFSFIKDNSQYQYCDDCLSEELEIFPRQQVNQICNRLSNENKLIRENGFCHSCGKKKLINIKNDNNLFQEKPIKKKVDIFKSNINQEVDLRSLHLHIVDLCRNLWNEKRPGILMPTPIPAINELKKGGFLPSHQANMMLTLCSLRNTYQHENVIFGKEEYEIAKNAWKIIEKWLE